MVGPTVGAHRASYKIFRRDMRSSLPVFFAILVKILVNVHPWTTHLYPHASLRKIYSVPSYVCPCVLSMDLETKVFLPSYPVLALQYRAPQCAPFTSWHLHNAASLNACFLLCYEYSNLLALQANPAKEYR